MIVRSFLLLALYLGSSFACNSAHQMSSADTVPKGEFRFGTGGAVSIDPNVQGDLDDGDSRTNVQALYWLRRGVTDKTEVSLMGFGVLSGAKVGVKHQVLGSRNETGPAVSMGLEVAGQVAPDFGDYTREVKRVDIWLPLHLGYRTSASTALYVSPRYARRLLWAANRDVISLNVAGGVVGVQRGTHVQVHLELSAFRNLTGFGGYPGSPGIKTPSENEFGVAGGVSF